MKTYSRVYFSPSLFLAISGRSQTKWKLKPRKIFPIYGIWETLIRNLQVCSFPGNLQVCSFPGNLQVCSFPGNLQVCSFPGNLQVCSFPGNLQVCSFPGNLQACSFPGHLQVCSFPGHLQVCSFPGHLQVCSFPGHLQVCSFLLWTKCHKQLQCTEQCRCFGETALNTVEKIHQKLQRYPDGNLLVLSHTFLKYAVFWWKSWNYIQMWPNMAIELLQIVMGNRKMFIIDYQK